MWKDFFYYKRGERIAMAIFLVFVALCLFANHLYTTYSQKRFETMITDSAFIATCDSFYLSLREEESHVRESRKQAVNPVPFDPNLTDSAGFVNLGLPPWIARNIVKYREKGGKFFRPEQLARIYGIDSLLYQSLLPYIRIDTLRLRKNYHRFQADSIGYDYPQKFEEVTLVELNQADTAILRKIPGIGIGFAKMLIHYRTRLGGYYSVEQLRELPGVTDSLYAQWQPWFYADAGLIIPVSVNRTSLTKLRNHPYLNFYQAKAISEFKREYKKINGWEDLSLLEEFTPADRNRLQPYLIFDE
ncbi:MAG: helix-hairpin-helix domain-containing protein [Bacteroidales bacterium]